MVEISSHWAETAPDKAPPPVWNKGWSTSAQPIDGLSRAEYIDLAHASLGNLIKKNDAFLQRQGLSRIIIPHEDYRDGFEKGTEKFQPWLSRYCRENGLNANAQVIVVACVKDDKASLFKEKARSTDRIRDFLRIMNIFQEGQTNKAAAKSIETMTNAIDAHEAQDGTIARKNYFQRPKLYGFRAYKCLELIEIDDDLIQLPHLKQYIALLRQAGETPEMLAEKKIEHGGQQNINGMTRAFMSISRQARNALGGYTERCTTAADVEKGRSAHHHMGRIAGFVKDLDEYGLAANNRVNAPFSHLLAPDLRDSYKPPSNEEMLALARKAIDAFPTIAKEIEKAGLPLPPRTISNNVFRFNG